MLKSKVENGSELLARLNRKPSVVHLEPGLFPDGVKPGMVAELLGEEGSGKTQYLIHVIANAILPPSLGSILLGGLGVAAILIDNDYTFNMLRLISVLEFRISSAWNSVRKSSKDMDVSASMFSDKGANNSAQIESHSATLSSKTEQSMMTGSLVEMLRSPSNEGTLPGKDATEKDVEGCLKECLKRLHVVRCNNSTQFYITLHTIETMLANNPEIHLLAIDSISAFHLADKYNGNERNLTLVSDMLRKLTDTYGLAIFATKAALFPLRSLKREADDGNQKEHHREYLCKDWQKLVSCRIVFSTYFPDKLDSNSNRWFRASVAGGSEKHLTIDESGVKFVDS